MSQFSLSTTKRTSDSLFDFPQSSGIKFPLIVSLSYIFAVPQAKWLSGSSGLAPNILRPALGRLLCLLSGNTSIAMQSDPRALIVLLTAFYIAFVYFLSAVMSVTGQQLGNKDGYKNREPRQYKRCITSGLPHRMIAAHEALLEIFPAFAVSAALVALSLPSAPGISAAEAALNALTLHVFVKLFIYIPAYLLDWDVVRSSSHTLSVGLLLVALWDTGVPQ